MVGCFSGRLSQRELKMATQQAVRALGHEVKDFLQQVYSSCLLLQASDGDEATQEVATTLLKRARSSKEKINTSLAELIPMKPPSLRLLIVEDEAPIRRSLRLMVEKAGHKVVAEAENGDDMVSKALNNDEVQLIVFDVHLPKCDGFEALKRINNERILPAVVVTGDDDLSLVERGMEEHVLGYLIKPIEPPELLAAIGVAYARFTEMMELREENDTLERQMTRRKLVERAKGVIQRRNRWDEQAAFRWLQKTAMNTRRPMEDICQDVMDGRM